MSISLKMILEEPGKADSTLKVQTSQKAFGGNRRKGFLREIRKGITSFKQELVVLQEGPLLNKKELLLGMEKGGDCNGNSFTFKDLVEDLS